MKFVTWTLRSLVAGLMIYATFLVAPSSRAAVQLPLAEQCFSFNSGINGMVGALGAITAGSGGTTGTYGGVALTGGSGTGATANITVSGGGVTAVAILNPGANYIVADVLSAVAADIGNTTGFSVPVNSTAINSALAGGSVAYYIPNTLTPKQTWQDAAGTIPNTNPITLDQNGCAIVYGNGTYRQIVEDSLGNVLWDQPTTAGTNYAWGGTSTGSANAQIIPSGIFTGQDGETISFIAGFTNTAATTLNGVQILKDTSAGPVSLVGGEIIMGNVITVVYDATGAVFHMQAPSSSTGGVVGEILDYVGTTAPTNFLLAYGQCVSQVTYAQLFAITGTGYGSCGAGLFAIPDLRGRVSAGADNMGGVAASRLTSTSITPNANTLGGSGGVETIALITANTPPYTPTGSVDTSALQVGIPVVETVVSSVLPNGLFASSPFTALEFSTSGQPSISGTATFTGVAQGGTSTPFIVVQPTVIVSKIIRYQ